jgi:iron complex outermembrane receptor protein
MINPTTFRLLCTGLLLPALAAAAPSRDVLTLSLEELARLPITAATGYARPQADAPAASTVIRAEEWEALGAQSVYDVLALLPGLAVVENGRPERQVVARGLLTLSNAEVLWLFDGQPLNDLGEGGAPLGFDKGLAGLERIEVIHGPVSVIHGSNAFSATINLVSREAGHTGSRVAVRGGAFDTRTVQAESGGAHGDWRWRASVEGRRTDGDPDRIIRSDVQTTFDALFGTQVTLAPGPLPNADDTREAHLQVGWRDTELHYWRYENDATGRIGGGALDPAQRIGQTLDHLTLRQSGKLPALDTRWEVEALAQRQTAFFSSNPLPPGTTIPINASGDIDPATGTPVLFPEGLLTGARRQNDRARLALTLVNTSTSQHGLRLGLGQEWQELRELESHRNFGGGVMGAPPAPPASPLPNLAGTPASELPPRMERHLSFIALQDDWQLHEDWLLNLGLRHDRYSDFGSSTNPRASLHWQASPQTRWRLGYSTAFRAPTFFEQFFRNNPTYIGNPDLDAEKLRSTELGLQHRLSAATQLDVTAFHYVAHDLVDVAPRPPTIGLVTTNAGRRNGHGATTELRWQPRPGSRLNASLSLWRVEDEATGANAPFVPNVLATLTGWQDLGRGWLLGGALRHVGHRHREPGDARAALGDDTRLDLHLHTTALDPRLKLGLTVQNVTDADLRDPTRNNLAIGSFIPDDLPLTGRVWLLEAEYRWGGRSDATSATPEAARQP